jgi:DNA-binding transcriptional ArsR family regulator
MLNALFVSKVRLKLLKVFLASPGKSFYVRELVRLTKEEINAVRRELDRMQKNGIVASEWRGNRRYYVFRGDYLFYPELLRMVNKTAGLGGAIIKNKAKLGKIKYAMLVGSFIKGRKPTPKEVVLLVVGNVVLPQLTTLVKAEEAKRDFEINYTVMGEEEFEFRKRRRDPFILDILSKSRLMLVGDEDEMLAG